MINKTDAVVQIFVDIKRYKTKKFGRENKNKKLARKMPTSGKIGCESQNSHFYQLLQKGQLKRVLLLAD